MQLAPECFLNGYSHLFNIVITNVLLFVFMGLLVTAYLIRVRNRRRLAAQKTFRARALIDSREIGAKFLDISVGDEDLVISSSNAEPLRVPIAELADEHEVIIRGASVVCPGSELTSANEFRIVYFLSPTNLLLIAFRTPHARHIWWLIQERRHGPSQAKCALCDDPAKPHAVDDPNPNPGAKSPGSERVTSNVGRDAGQDVSPGRGGGGGDLTAGYVTGLVGLEGVQREQLEAETGVDELRHPKDIMLRDMVCFWNIQKYNISGILRKMDGWMEGGREGGREGGMEGWMEGWRDGWVDGDTSLKFS